jgi:lipid A 4'-phosphatase
MNRTGLLIALAVAAVVGLLFGLYPKLDLDLAGVFFDPARDGFWARTAPPVLWLRDLARAIVTVLVAPAILAPVVKLVAPRRPMLIPGRAAVLLIVTLALAPGVLTNLILKDHWGRPRPIDVVAFGGDLQFLPWWDPRGACEDNCSFVAGEPSGAFWTLAPALLLPAPWRALAGAAALAFGTGIGIVRMAGGGHFFSDIAFAGVFTFLVIWLVHGFLYRWPATRISDRAVERALERIALWTRHPLARLGGGGPAPRIDPGAPPGAAAPPRPRAAENGG